MDKVAEILNRLAGENIIHIDKWFNERWRTFVGTLESVEYDAEMGGFVVVTDSYTIFCRPYALAITAEYFNLAIERDASDGGGIDIIVFTDRSRETRRTLLQAVGVKANVQ